MVVEKAQAYEEMKTLSDIIVNTIPVEKIILFGSFVNGIPHEDSDLDIYVVIKDGLGIRDIDAMKLISKAISKVQTMPVDIVVTTKTLFQNRLSLPTFERTVETEGMAIYG